MTKTTAIQRLHRQILAMMPELQDMIDGLVKNNADYETVVCKPAELICRIGSNDEAKINEILEGFREFSDVFKQKQFEFTRNESYQSRNYKKINKDVYQNRRYMTEVYYPALLCSYVFSSNYFDILRVFSQQFMPSLSDKKGTLCEVGIGHGLLSALLLSEVPSLESVGVDISPYAAEMVSLTSNYFNLKKPIQVTVSDATKGIPDVFGSKYNVMICAEVLEHIPTPEGLLRNIYNALDQEGILFLTAAVNMESVDHLFLFKSDNDVLEMVRDHGFDIVQKTNTFLSTQPYRGNFDLSQKLMKRKNPANVILIVKKRNLK